MFICETLNVFLCVTYPEAPSFSRVSLERRTLTSLKTSLNSPGGECKIKSDAILTCIMIYYSFKVKILNFSRLKNYLLLTLDPLTFSWLEIVSDSFAILVNPDIENKNNLLFTLRQSF